MSFDQITLVFYGLPIAVLAMGLRRSLGLRGTLLVGLAAAVVTLYGVLLDAGLRRYGIDLPVPAREFTAGSRAPPGKPVKIGSKVVPPMAGRSHSNWRMSQSSRDHSGES